jgi:hypothetical protein
MQQQRSNVHTQSAASSFLSGLERTLLITKTTTAEHAPASHTRRGIECDNLCPLLVCFVARAQATAVNSPPATGKAKDPTSGSLAGPESPGYGPIPGAVTGTAGPLWPCQWELPRPGQTPSRPRARAAIPASGPPSDKPAAGVGDREAVNSTPGAHRPATRWRPVRRGMLRIAEWQGLSALRLSQSTTRLFSGSSVGLVPVVLDPPWVAWPDRDHDRDLPRVAIATQYGHLALNSNASYSHTTSSPIVVSSTCLCERSEA